MAGRNTKLSNSQIFDLNAVGYPQYQIGLGSELAEPKNLKQANINQLETDENFFGHFVRQLQNGGATAGTTGAVNELITMLGNCFEYCILGAGQTLKNMANSANGLDFSGDVANNEGFEITQGITQYSAKHAFVAGTDKFYAEAKIKISDVSETDTLLFGFRKAEAYQAAFDDYDEMCAVNVNAGDVYLSSILNGGATVNTDTTLNVSDTNYIKIRLEYDVTKALSSAITLANSIKRIYTAHIANTTQHTAAADTVNVITAADANDLTTLIALVSDLLTQYAAHETDAAVAPTPTYHAATETGSHALVSTVAPTTLTQAVTRLNDLKLKFKGHDDDATAHGVVTQYPVSEPYASAVTWSFGINTTTMTALNNSLAGFAFDAAEVVVPFLFFLHGSGSALEVDLMSWKVGSL